jgi:high potential iron-sulfur protein
MKEHEIENFRRRLLKQGAALIGGILAFPILAAEEKPSFKGLRKRSKESVGYRDFPYERRTCSKCVLYVGEGECVIVEGKVDLNGWCTQWTPGTMS